MVRPVRLLILLAGVALLLCGSARTARGALSLRLTQQGGPSGGATRTILDNDAFDANPTTGIIATTPGALAGFDFTGSATALLAVDPDSVALFVTPNVTAAADATLIVEATATDLTDPAAVANFLSSVASGTITGTGTATFESFVDRGNTPFGMGDVRTGPIFVTGTQGATRPTAFTRGASAFSLTTAHVINLSANENANIPAAALVTVPEPGSLALWAGLASALGVSGLVAARRGRNVRAGRASGA